MADMDCRNAFTGELLECAREDKTIFAVATDSRGSVTLTDLPTICPSSLWNAALPSRTP